VWLERTVGVVESNGGLPSGLWLYHCYRTDSLQTGVSCDPNCGVKCAPGFAFKRYLYAKCVQFVLKSITVERTRQMWQISRIVSGVCDDVITRSVLVVVCSVVHWKMAVRGPNTWKKLLKSMRRYERNITTR